MITTAGQLACNSSFTPCFVAGAVGAISETYGDLQRAAGASERLSELLTRQEPEIMAPEHPVKLPREGARRGVVPRRRAFRYPSRPDAAALNGFSLDIAPGDAVALVGPSGAGKSTVFQLLLRFFAPQGGSITFDGVDVADLDPTDLRRHIAIVAQDSVIFSGTIADNIRYGRPGASDDDVRRAAAEGSSGRRVHRASAARLSNARRRTRRDVRPAASASASPSPAPYCATRPLLLLDEATSALDAENERLVQLGLNNLMSGRTTIVIAHRLATIQRLKRIIVMEDGRIVAEGSHAELVSRGGLYKRLADLQFSQGVALLAG